MAVEPRVSDNPDASQYEIFVEERVAGIAEYQRRPGRIVFVHTTVAPDFLGRGLADQLARAALDDVRTRGEVVIARCPFFAAFIARHEEYADLLAGNQGVAGSPEARGA